MDYAIQTQFFTSLTGFFSNLITDPVMAKYIAFLPIAMIGILSSFLLTPLIGKIAWQIGATYKPGAKRKGKDFDNPEKAVHEKEVPALGGLSVLLPAFIITLISFEINFFTIPILAALLVLMVGSALDDIFNLDSKIQFGYQILACLIIVVSVIDLSQISFVDQDIINLSAYTLNFSILRFPFSIVLPGDIILFLWLMLCLNAVKWIGGSPGLLESYSTVIFTLLFIIGVRVSSDFSATVSIVVAGGLLGFLFYAIPPEKILSGSSGKSVYGFLIALLALINESKISTTIMLLSLPLLDAAFVVLKRIVTHKPKSFFQLMRINDTFHFHHQLMKLNISKTQILLIEGFIALIIGSIAIATAGAMKYFALIFGLSIILLLIVIINFKAEKRRKEKEKETPESKYSY